MPPLSSRPVSASKCTATPASDILGDGWRIKYSGFGLWTSIFGFGCILCLAYGSVGQEVVWRTNYYNVFGTNSSELRRSLEKARPWKDDYDARTSWQVSWNFSLTPVDESCRCTG